ncbi:adenine deaminase C-terminal domain-containing protein [Bacillus marasmi]|uniref:adenine deaminase C-terminal domain-containing protein n=1 Tax=Bacillus marasmi TaxID=1926279 RepID=UPI0011CA6905|nr:adenine deaminase C-terminal domain-containing protein [Bacillus marasmi]
MATRNYRWSNKQLRDHVKVLDEIITPHIVLKNATYLNTYLQQWLVANVWIYDDRIVYVGEKLPENQKGYELLDCEGNYIVPGYIEPHAHPFQLYNPVTLAKHAGQFGTTTLINDNLNYFLALPTEVTFDLLKEFKNLPSTMYWWCRFDAQTELPNNDMIFNTEDIINWLEHDSVLQGGELTAWPKLLNGDDTMLSWVQEAKSLNKKVEGHFPGASERTLAKMMLIGADCDHEAMTGQEALTRLKQGYTVSLRNSSIRPDLEVLLKELLELGIERFDRFFFTSDGSHPYFYENGMTDELIKMAISQGIPLIDAYLMSSYNVARYYNMEHLHGSIATGRIANINILDSRDNPTPISVLAKGKWIKRDGAGQLDSSSIEWEKYQLSPLKFNWTLQKEDLRFVSSTGIQLVNNVITKRYETSVDLSADELPLESDELFLMMVARDGSWRVNTVVKGFAQRVGGFVSSYSGTGDFLIMGKRRSDMLLAFTRMQELGGGLVLVEDNQILHEIPLSLIGLMSDEEMHILIDREKKLIELLKERGYQYDDPAFTLLFFSATHLPFIRLTPSGLYDVKNRQVLVPPTKRIYQTN